MTTNAPRPAAADRIAPAVWKVAAVVSVGSFMSQMDSTLVNVSLSTIGHALDARLATAQWIVTGYLLAMALTLPLNGWLVDRIGAKRLYLFCFSTFTFASALCGFAHSMSALIAARLFQGLIAGMLVPMAQMMIGRVAGKHLERVMGYATLPILLGPILGPVLAGAILTHAAWPWLYFVNVPIGVIGVAMAWRLLPRDADTLDRRRFDFLGFALISPGLVALVYGLQNAAHSAGLACVLAGVLLLAAFIVYSARKGDAALIDVRIFSTRIFAFAAVTQFCANGMLFGRQLLVPLYLILACGLSAAQAGVLLAATGVGMMAAFAVLGPLTERFGCRALAAGGALLACAATFVFAWMAAHTYSTAWALVSLALAGIGQGTISVPSISAAYAALPKANLPTANTALNIAQRIGGPFATTLISLTVALAMRDSGATQAHHFVPAFVLLAALHGLCLAATMGLPVRVIRK
ncbi:DHA2 family efflux MFS transporter permease subunit [Paraburkholderia sp. J94]|uniref:DHA2 family efflux MFS transporter permease subunit n=1 Tax=Paraburkholderia sp. J94 TaxID=2805441 RepID=UPI002AAF9899|nr:DHA2 family efflux MFS transporter permease subunit [Paraburkholderia sp. J94]